MNAEPRAESDAQEESRVAWHALSPSEILAKLETGLVGLSGHEAKDRLVRYGKNELEKKRNWSAAKLFKDQFKDILAQILLIAAALSLVFGEFRDATIIVTIVLVNALVGFFQEFKAEKILDEMEKLTTDKAFVFRDGMRHEVDARELVPGDIVLVDAGTKMPADGYILESYDCRVDGFIFSGESRPEERVVKVMEAETALSDIENMIFMGESIVTGEAKLVVVGTGSTTELGRLAGLMFAVPTELTPLQKRMRTLGRSVAVLSLFIAALVVIAGQYLHVSWYESFLLALALAVSVVPEGLPAAISVALALGMKRLLKRNVLAKRLNAVETLGSVTTICTDKTGTITRNELMVTRIVAGGKTFSVTGEGYIPRGDFFSDGQSVALRSIPNGELLFRIATLCNGADLLREDDRYSILGDPTEGALLVAAQKYNSDPKFFTAGERKVMELPFASERMRMSVAYANDTVRSYVKGSPDVLLDLAVSYLDSDGHVREFTPEEKEKVREQYNGFSTQALRVLGFAYRDLTSVAEQHYTEEMERELVWVGMMAMIDPPRGDVHEAVTECRELGIRVVMITGDYALTAEAIAREVGLIDATRPFEVLSGKEVATLTDDDIFAKMAEKDIVFARIAPEQKLRIATLLRERGEVIAMTGDGVNDAPALKRADIGVAMGIMGTDVSKEAADMILLDDHFSSIVAGVKEGRTVYANLRKFVHYVFTSNVSELFTVLLGFALQIPAPIAAVQILAIDLGTDIFPSFALGVEPEERATKGRSRWSRGKQRIIDFAGVKRLLSMGAIMALGAVLAFMSSLVRDGWWWGTALDKNSEMYFQAASATYVVLAVSQMANLFEARSERLRMREVGWFRNWYVWGALLVSMGILWMFLHAAFFQKYLHMRPIDMYDWVMVGLTTAAVFWYEERRKRELVTEEN